MGTNRLAKNTAVLAKVEATYGVDAVPTGAQNAMLVSNFSMNPLNSQNVDRALMRPYFGASEMLIGPASAECSFDVELVGSGAAGTAPPWFALMRAAGLTQTLIAATRADITPITNGAESNTIYYHDDGVLKKFLGACGEASFSLKAGGIAKATLKFIGLDGGDSAVNNPAGVYTAWQQPQVIYTATSAPVLIGSTCAATGAPALVGGVAYPSMGMEFSMGNVLAFNPFLGGETVDIVDRKVTGKVTFNLTAAQEVSFMSTIKAGTLQSLAMVAGNVANRRLLVHLASCQLMNPTKTEAQGLRTITVDFRALPVNGNDEVRFVTSY